MRETELSRELSKRVKLLDQGIAAYLRFKDNLLERIAREKAGSDSTAPEPGIIRADPFRDKTELLLYNLALIASNELKVSHRATIGLLEIIVMLLPAYPKEMEIEIQRKLTELAKGVAETPF